MGREQSVQFVRRDFEEAAVPGRVDGLEDEGDPRGVLGDAGAVGVAVVPVAGQDVGVVGVDDLARPGVLDGVRFAERGEGLGAVGVPDDDVAGDVVRVEGPGGQAVVDGEGVVRVDGRVDARQGSALGEAPAERVTDEERALIGPRSDRRPPVSALALSPRRS